MSVSRRRFFRAVGVGSAGLSTSFIIGRGREAMAFESAVEQPPDDGGFIRISSNENARGPGRKTMEALQRATTPRVGRGYPPDYADDLVETIAASFGVGRTSVILGTGSGPILEAATRAFCTTEKRLVTAAPTFTTCEQTARRMGVPVKVVQVDRSLGLDIEAMAEAAKGAGLVFFCNPNNPTGTVHNAATVERFVRRVKQASPDTSILLDEAYIDYVHDPAAKTAAPLTQELAGVFITRSVLEGPRHGGAAPGLRHRAARHRAGHLACLGAGQPQHTHGSCRHRLDQGHQAPRRGAGRERARPRLHASDIQGSGFRRAPIRTPIACSST